MLVMKTSDVDRIHMKDFGFANVPQLDFVSYKRRLAVDTKLKSEILLKDDFAPCLIRLDKDVLVRVEIVNDQKRRDAYLKVSPLYSSARKYGVAAVLEKFKHQFLGNLVAELPNELRYKEIWYDYYVDDHVEC